MEYEYTSLADDDVQEIFSWYEDQQEGRGVIFLFHLEKAVELVRGHPYGGSSFEDPVRKRLIEKYPYFIYYTVQSRRILILRVVSTYRDPDTIRKMIFGGR
jgi:plasmid stabilization system protein ParE